MMVHVRRWIIGGVDLQCRDVRRVVVESDRRCWATATGRGVGIFGWHPTQLLFNALDMGGGRVGGVDR